jgi:hypothetical protein
VHMYCISPDRSQPQFSHFANLRPSPNSAQVWANVVKVGGYSAATATGAANPHPPHFLIRSSAASCACARVTR